MKFDQAKILGPKPGQADRPHSAGRAKGLAARGLAVLLLGLGLLATLPARTITDHAGRSVTIPDTIKSYYTTSQIGIIALYALNPDKLVGWGFALTNGEQAWIPPKYHKLPVLGVWSGKNGSGNVEEIARAKPDVILSIGDAESSTAAQAERIQTQTGIPVVVVKAPLTGLGDMFRFVGKLTGDASRGTELADYCDKTVGRVQTLVKSIPADKKVGVYYAEGPKGLETDPSGSMHTEVLDLVGGRNVAQVQNQKGYGRTPVSLEQLYVWNPEVILVGKDKEGPSDSADLLLKNPDWQPIKAIQKKTIYVVPNNPFDWFDRPPSANRIIGILWLFKVLYPDLADYDLVQEVRTFYQLFYRKDPGADGAKSLLAESGWKP